MFCVQAPFAVVQKEAPCGEALEPTIPSLTEFMET